MIRLILAIAMIQVSMTVAAADSYLCVSDMATGFVFEKAIGKWKSTTLNPDKKFLVKRTGHKKGPIALPTEMFVIWDVTVLGDPGANSMCHMDFDARGNLRCLTGSFVFELNRDKLRFTSAAMYGYANWGGVDFVLGSDSKYTTREQKEGDHQPTMDAGKCSPL